MKKIYIIIYFTGFSFLANAQDFSKHLTEARSSYSSGSLSDARFSIEQMLYELDIAIGQEILQLLPVKMNSLDANLDQDNVTGAGAGIGMGLYVNRTYGAGAKTASIDIINNSPLINSLNAILSLPFVGRSSDASQKVVKVQGYKSILNKSVDDAGQTSYELQIPFNNTLMTFKADDISETEILKLADTIPLAKIAQMAN